MNKDIQLDAPNFDELEKHYLCRAVDENYVSTIGPFVKEFEKKFSKWLGNHYVVSLQSGTAALHMALHELGIGDGDEVIVPALTFIATVNPIVYMRAIPVFVDVDPETWNIDPDKVGNAITPRTRAIIVTHLYGNPCDMERIMTLADKHGIHVIEDAAESLGAIYDGCHTGTFGEFGCFSFNGNKIITTGGGGMILSRDKKKIEHIRFLINQARHESCGYFCSEIGFNYRMTNIEAALGLAQMEKLVGFIEKKRLFNEIYREELKSLKGIAFQKETARSKSSWWLNCIVFENDIDIASLQRNLKKQGIPSRMIFYPIVDMPPYQQFGNKPFPNTRYIYKHGICLPSSTLNDKDDISRVCQVLKEIV